MPITEFPTFDVSTAKMFVLRFFMFFYVLGGFERFREVWEGSGGFGKVWEGFGRFWEVSFF